MFDSLLQLLEQNQIFTPETLLTYWGGFVTTVQLVFLSLIIGLFLSVPFAVLRSLKNPLIAWPIWFYCYVFRGTPLLVQLYIIYYGIPYIEGIQDTFWWSIFREPFYPALIAFVLNTTAYTTEIIYGSIVATDHGELEAAQAYGMGWWTRMRRIILPAAFRRALPAYSNEVIFMLHASAIASVVTIVDLTGAAQNVYSKYYAPFEAFIFVACIYLCITFSIVFVFKKIEHRLLAYMRPLNT
ncbi:ABC transporter permease [Gynuella sunshinyii]|uniref:Arginine ABC transporter permease protein ArtM n=1 Tax=Gynuella sunshinyii YC6258 TaxID=1445510 RepID=A0A0C5V1V2_9GAMM|nr:ABC transporter permease [Gynuella sunshinyii]AJQ93535.1 ABC-type arginine/histidine transport system, permease component [Gynuella sunshinyii YC6258]